MNHRQAAASAAEPAGTADAQDAGRTDAQRAAYADTHGATQKTQKETENMQDKTQKTQKDTGNNIQDTQNTQNNSSHNADAQNNIQMNTDRGESGTENDENDSSDKMFDDADDVQSQQDGKEQTGHTATRVAESVLDEESVLDDELLKLAVKRKSSETKESSAKTTKVSKTELQCSSSHLEENTQSTLQSDDDDDDDDGNNESMQDEIQSGYSFQRVRAFLTQTKGSRGVKVEDHFPDLQLFYDSVRFYMKNTRNLGQPSFTDPEIFRLRKFLVKVRDQIASDD
ncbi:hypothetical protein ABVT39_011248 [Epinephelus coioides]